MRHRTEKYKEKPTRKNPNKERVADVKGTYMEGEEVKKQQEKAK